MGTHTAELPSANYNLVSTGQILPIPFPHRAYPLVRAILLSTAVRPLLHTPQITEIM